MSARTTTGRRRREQVEVRRRLVRQLMARHTPKGKIKAILMAGVHEKDPKSNAVTLHIDKVSDSTARADLKAVEDQFAGVLSDERVLAVELGTCLATQGEIIGGAMDAGAWGAASGANVWRWRMVAKLAQRSDLHLSASYPPSHMEDPDETPEAGVGAREAELKELPIEELEREAGKALQRARDAGINLEVLTGGAVAGEAAPSSSPAAKSGGGE